MARRLTLSIRNMLLGLALAGVVAIFGLSFVAMFSNHRMEQFQEELLENAFPVSQSVRGMMNVVMRLNDRQHKMMAAASLDELTTVPPLATLELDFFRERQRLDGLLTRFPAAGELLTELDRDFGELLEADGRCTEQQWRRLQLAVRVEGRVREVEQTAEEIVQVAEALAGEVRLEDQRSQRRIRHLLEKNGADTSWIALARKKILSDQPAIQDIAAKVHQGSLALTMLSRKLMIEKHQDLLPSIRSNGIDQAMGVIRDSLALLHDRASEDIDLRPFVQKLETSFLQMPPLLVEKEDSLYALLQSSFIEDEEFRIRHAHMMQSADQVMRDVEHLASPAGLLRNEIATDAKRVVVTNRWALIVVNTLAPILIAATLFFFLRWLMRRTRRIVHALQGCAEGDYSRRVPLEGNRDELEDIAVTVNTLAQTLQRLEAADLHAIMSRVALNALLETSLTPLTLQAYLKVALQIILSIPWIQVWNNKAAFFLTDEKTGALQLLEHVGLCDEEQTRCAQVEPGHCLCGAALTLGEVVFADSEDARHGLLTLGEEKHGHYCVPILSRGRVLGVFTLQLNETHRYDREEVALLTIIAHTLAGVIERKRMEESLQHLAHHDVLTGLPNRQLFHEHLERVLARAARARAVAAVMLLDLDRFKQVNDTYGHAVGDQLLVEVTRRIQVTLRASDLLARLGGDEFALVLDEISSLDVAIVAEKIVRCLVEPFVIQGATCYVGVSIGIGMFPEHGVQPDVLLSRADRAMYDVKAHGRNGFRYAQIEK
ncbi:MAG: diguanylate cyclase [Magnetococcales bacterium]|nr:diguanylate cyclase [Magnetococcales bacterium]